jgi:tRNA1(Val) A37 N6-methylase TrmN6
VSGETTDDLLLGGRLRLRQPRDGLRATTDAIMLAAAVPAGEGDRVLDVGCGSGVAALCVAARVAGCHVAGIDADAALAALATLNAERNGLADRARFAVAGVEALPVAGLDAGAFDHVLTNPPYLPAARGRSSASAARRAATVETFDLAPWIAACARMAAPKGTLTVVHRADRLDDLVAALGRVAGSLVVFPLWPGGKRQGDAQRILVRARRGGRSPLRLAPGLVLHGPDGHYTPAAEAILRQGAALAI